MPIETGPLHHFAIRVRDAERSKQFYGEALGFPLLREQEREDDVVLNFNAHGTVFGVRAGHASTSDDDSFDPFRVGLDHLALQVPDFAALDQLAANLDAAGVRHDDVVEEPHGARYICFYDPEASPGSCMPCRRVERVRRFPIWLKTWRRQLPSPYAVHEVPAADHQGPQPILRDAARRLKQSTAPAGADGNSPWCWALRHANPGRRWRAGPYAPTPNSMYWRSKQSLHNRSRASAKR